MKLVDITKCHEDSPDFRSSLSQLEEATNSLEKRLKLITSLCEERRALNEKEREVTQKLIRQFDLIASNNLHIPDPMDSDAALNSVEVMTTAMKQLVEHQERMCEQVDIGIMQPLQHFLTQDLEQVKVSKKAYYKAHSDAQQVTEKFGQCKKHEVHLLNEISLQLIDIRSELHKATCKYTLDLNFLHSKKTPNFLNRIVDFMMSQLSFFHLGHVTAKDTEPNITTIYSLVEKLNQEVVSRDTQHRSQADKMMEDVLYSRIQNLLHFFTEDLHIPLDTARATISQYLSKTRSDSVVLERYLDLPTKTATSSLTKSGYLWYAEPRTFGTHWIRLYFSIKNSMLVSEATSKIKTPISLNLNLCNVKPAEVNDTERNFSFKVTSPIRVLLLQAEGSLEMQDWLDTLGGAITHAIHNAPPGGDLPTSPPTSSASKGSRGSSSTNSIKVYSSSSNQEPMPIKPPRRKSTTAKDLFNMAGNDVCADCRAAKPKWASINLGVLICIECSGVHRSLGVYISQVRSLTLDSLKPSILRHLKAVGNVKSNSVYEALLPPDFDRSRLKNEENRLEFITEKYVIMKYASPEDKERILLKRQEVREETLRKSGITANSATENSNTAITSGEGPSTTTSGGVPIQPTSKATDSEKVVEKVEGKEVEETAGGTRDAVEEVPAETTPEGGGTEKQNGRMESGTLEPSLTHAQNIDSN